MSDDRPADPRTSSPSGGEPPAAESREAHAAQSAGARGGGSAVSEQEGRSPGAIRDALLAALPGSRPGDRSIRGLAERVEELLGARSHPDRVDAFVRLVRWSRGGPSVARPPEAPDAERRGGGQGAAGARDAAAARRGGGQGPERAPDGAAAGSAARGGRGDRRPASAPAAAPGLRMQMLLRVLEGSPELASRLRGAVATILTDAAAANLFGEAGLPSGRGFFAELSDRLIERLVPRPRDDHDLAKVLASLFRTEAEVRRFAGLGARTFARISAGLLPAGDLEAWGSIGGGFSDGFRLLACRVQAEGLSEAMRARSRPGPVDSSPFFRIVRTSDALLGAREAGADPRAAADAWRRDCAACREELAEVHRRIEEEGVSISIVHALEVIERALGRMELMVEVMLAPGPEASAAASYSLLSHLAEAAHEERSIARLVVGETRLLHRRIVERAGRMGEHYIAFTRREYWGLWIAAAGGGLLTVFTAAAKLAIHGWHLPAFPEGLLYGLNYAASFVLMQHLGLVLATKQPAMTAATLASILRERRGEARAEEIITFTSRICRSQIAAALGNVIVVSMGAYAFNRIWGVLTDRPFLELEAATDTFRTLSPLDSGTIFYAALTGVVLFLASQVGGWVDNWAAYHRVAQGIAESPLGERLGRERMGRIARAFTAHIPGWGTNISLGFMLGMTPDIGRFLGVPLDVRHVTLSTGTLSLAAASLRQDWLDHDLAYRAGAGIAVMFVLNLSVSFLLSLYTAIQAYGLHRSDAVTLLRTLARRALRRPGEFLLPPRRDLERPGGGHRH